MVKTSEDKNGNTKIYFGVGDMPMKPYEEFESFVKREYGGCRWMAIKSLMDFRKARKDVGYLIEEVSYIKQELLNIKPIESTEEPNFEEYSEGGSMTLGKKGIKLSD